MKALRYYAPRKLQVDDLPKPIPNPDQALIKILYSGICGSDLHIYRQGMFMTYAPETLGHEFVGIVETAPLGSGYKKGDIVTANPAVYCNKCEACQRQDFIHCENLCFIGEVCPGCHAEYMLISPNKLIKFADSVDIRQAAVVEPLAVAHHACKIISQYAKNDIAIFGCGPIGILIGYLLKNMYHIEQITMIDKNQYRLQQAAKLSFYQTAAALEEAETKEFSTIVDVTGSAAAFKTELQSLKSRGTLIIAALFEELPTADINILVNKELKIVGDNAYTHEEMQEAVKIIESNRYDFSWLISRFISCDEAPQAFEDLCGRTQDLKIIIDFTDNNSAEK